MNRFIGTYLLAATALAVVALAAQPAAAQRGGRGGFGRMRAYPAARLATLSEVQADLKLSDEQKTKVSEIADQLQDDLRGLFGNGGPPDMDQLEKLNQEATAKVDAALDPAQAKRLQEITIQTNGASSLNDPEVRKQLNFTDEQTKKYDEARDANRDAMQELFGLSREERGEKLDEYRKAADDRLLGVLTPEQKTEFEAMKGAPIDLDLSSLRGRGGGGGGGGGEGRRGRRNNDSGN
jgi:Spy/CpxP family protein refolding chaperone